MPQYKYLRVSVTDKCNFNCVYCRSEYACRMRQELLTFEDIVRAVDLLKNFGISCVRLTGGEPLLRRDISKLIEMLAGSVQDVNLTTNGALLAGQAESLALAGLKFINVHIDTLDEGKFYKLTGGGDINTALLGIEAARESGIFVKLNTVLLAGINDDETEDLVLYARSIGAPIRFIELMPFCDKHFYERHFISAESVFKKFNLKPIEAKAGHGPAEYYSDQETGAIIGIISSVTRKFCSACDRLRLTSNGTLKRCLADEEGIDLLRSNFSEDVVEKYLSGKTFDHNNYAHLTDTGLRAIGG